MSITKIAILKRYSTLAFGFVFDGEYVMISAARSDHPTGTLSGTKTRAPPEIAPPPPPHRSCGGDVHALSGHTTDE